MVALNEMLIAFKWDKWRWSLIAEGSAFAANTFLVLSERQNKIFAFRRVDPKRCYIYDFESSAVETISCKGTPAVLQRGFPIYCYDDLNETIFAFQTSGKK